MTFGDQFKDTPDNRKSMQQAAEAYASMQGIVYIVVKDKSSGQLGAIPRSMFDPATQEVIFEVSGGGERAAEQRWDEIIKRLEKQCDLPDQDDG